MDRLSVGRWVGELEVGGQWIGGFNKTLSFKDDFSNINWDQQR